MRKSRWSAGGFLALAAMAAVPTARAQGPAGFDCLMEPSQVVEVRSAVDGLVARMHVRRGDAIRKGQPLVELQSGVERVTVELARHRTRMEGAIVSARNRVEYATAKLARMNELNQKNYLSSQARDEAEAERKLADSELRTAVENRELAEIELRRYQELLALRTLTAPFDGVVLERMANPGDLAEAGAGRKPVLRVAQIDPLKVDIVLPAALIGSVKPGTPVTLAPRGSEQRYGAKVTTVDKVVDAASGTFVVGVDLPNPQGAIAGGVRCSAVIQGVAPPVPAAGGRTTP